MMDEKIKKVWEAIIEADKEYIKTHKDFSPVCFIIKENYNIETIIMLFENSNSKEVMKQKLKKLIVSQRLRGYILCMDTKLSHYNIESGEIDKVSDALVHNLFTPKEKIVHVVVYDKDKKFTEEYEEDKGKLVSDWDIWNYEERDKQQKKIEEEYFDFKQKNPDKYKGVCT